MMSEEDVPLTKRSKQPIKRAGKVEDIVQDDAEVGKVKILNGTTEGKKVLEKKEATKKAEKKHYDKLGQTKDTPEERDGERIFYSTLLEQKPESHMAKKWLLQHGLLPEDETEKFMKEEAKHKPTAKVTNSGKGSKNNLKPVSVSKQTPAKTPQKRPAKKQPDDLKPVKVQKTQPTASRGRKPKAKSNENLDEDDAPLSSRTKATNNNSNSRKKPPTKTPNKRGRAKANENSDEDNDDVPLSSRGRGSNNNRQKQSAATNKRSAAKKYEEDSEEDDVPLSKRTKVNEGSGSAVPSRSRRAHNKAIIENSESDGDDDVPLSARAVK